MFLYLLLLLKLHGYYYDDSLLFTIETTVTITMTLYISCETTVTITMSSLHVFTIETITMILHLFTIEKIR